MSFSSTQNSNPVYNVLTANVVDANSIQTDDLVTSTFTATTLDATTLIATTINANVGNIVDINATTVDANIITATNSNGTTIACTTASGGTFSPNTLSLNAPITTSNATQPAIGQLGYLVVVANTVDVPLTTTLESTAVVTPADIPIGVYQVNARVQLTIDAGTTIDSLQIQIETTAGTIAGEINNNPVVYAGASQYSTTQSVAYFNTVAQVLSIRVTATFAGGNVSIQTGNAKLSLVRIA